MPIDPEIALGAELPSQTFSWDASDVALYNLAVGAARDPLDTAGLRYVDDRSPLVLPSFATVAATMHVTEAPKVSFPGVEIDLAKVVHGAQHVFPLGPIPASGTATTRTKIAELQDKGKAAVIVQESTTTAEDGTELWRARSSIFARDEGGFGGERGTSEKVTHPEREPDHEIEVPTAPNQALLYRLCGDRNPLHSDPEFAQRAGFDRPIMHGLGSYGLVLRALVDSLYDGDVARISQYGVSFAGILFPGETLRVRAWRTENGVVATADSVERDNAPVLGNIVLAQKQ